MQGQGLLDIDVISLLHHHGFVRTGFFLRLSPMCDAPLNVARDRGISR
jgi:hypothetical protein